MPVVNSATESNISYVAVRASAVTSVDLAGVFTARTDVKILPVRREVVPAPQWPEKGKLC